KSHAGVPDPSAQKVHGNGAAVDEQEQVPNSHADADAFENPVDIQQAVPLQSSVDPEGDEKHEKPGHQALGAGGSPGIKQQAENRARRHCQVEEEPKPDKEVAQLLLEKIADVARA